ncbi:MAG: choice-of-anchor D domain-containing protein [Deltaproteobacteria bacterium]|nr:choice-of-anchor D domain-containing protein [Deltaproteobacteria bacterium]
MNLRRKATILLFIIAALPIALNCDCEGGSNITPDEALVDHYYIGNVETSPALDLYAETQVGDNPEQAEINVDFGLVDLEALSTKYLFIRNTGTAILNVSSIAWEQEDSSFVLSCFDGGIFTSGCDYNAQNVLSIAVGSDLIIQITYSPVEVASHAASFVITSNANDFKTIKVNLSGQGVTPEIQVCITDCIGPQESVECQGGNELCNDAVDPENLLVQFGDADVMAGESVSRRVLIRNLGDQALSISNIQLQNGDFEQFKFQVEQGDLPGSIAGGAEAALIVTYDPSLGGEHSADLQIISNDVNERELSVRLEGRGLAPRVCPDPIVLDFEHVPVGVPEEKFFTITNCGLLDLDLKNVLMNATSSADFSLVNLPALPQALAPSASVEIHVVYNPSDRGTDAGGVDIFSDDPSSDPNTDLTGTVALMGNGIVLECDIQVIPFTLSFGGLLQNTSDIMILTLTNQGNDTCHIDSVELFENSADDEFTILSFPADGTTFEPGDVIMPQIEVEYAPINLGVDTGKLRIMGNDKDGAEMIIDIVGEGVATAECELTIQPTSLQFGTVKLHNTMSQVLTLVNSGNAVCNITEPEYIPSTLFHSDFAITRGPNGPFTLARRGQPGDREEIEITFAPTDLDLHAGRIWLHTDDDPDFIVGVGVCFKPGWPPIQPEIGDACINFTGFSAESDIEVVPAELDFGVVTVGCNSPERHVTIYNLGTLELGVKAIYLENPADPNFEIMYAPAASEANPYILSGGGSFEIRLRYHPQDTNPHRSTLYIESDATNVELLAIPLFGRGTNISDQTDIFHQPEEVRSDVLFVVDNSGSMGWAQSELASNFSTFIESAETMDVDFHVGVIATEVNDPETDQGSPPRDIFPGVLIQTDTSPKIITNTTPDVSGAFANNVKIGTCCSDEQEAGLQAAWMALSPPNVDDPSMNAGFLREDAKLYIICVSDEQDQSKGTPDFYVDYFSSIKGYRNTEMMKVSAIVIPSPKPGGCGADSSSPGTRYIEVADRTGGIFESLCTSNWAQALDNLGIDAFASIREFPLSRPADENTIVVTINDVEIPEASSEGGADGWTYYEDTNTIYFGDDYVPEKGDKIEVSYTAVCL